MATKRAMKKASKRAATKAKTKPVTKKAVKPATSATAKQATSKANTKVAKQRPAKKSSSTGPRKGTARKSAVRTTAVKFEYVNLVQPLPGASARQLAAIEAHFGGQLPGDYADFLRGINGGCPRPSYVGTNPKSGFEIEAFYGAGAASAPYDVLAASKRASNNIGHAVVAIAGDGSGDQLVYLAPGDARVYHWRHDDEAEPKRVAKSFDDLLGSLT